MDFIDLDTAQFYQPPTRTGRRGHRQFVASSRGVPTAHKERDNPVSFGPSNMPSGRLEDYDLIECVDLTGPPTELLDLFCEPAQVNGAEVHAGGPSNGLETQGSHGHGSHEEEDEFPSIKELLGVRGAQGSQRGGLCGEHRTGRSDGVFEYSAEPDCNSAPTPRSRRHENDCGDLDSFSGVHTSDSSTSEEQCGTQGSVSTPPTSVAGSEAGDPALHEKKNDPISNLPPSPHNILLSFIHEEVTCESSSGVCRDIESAHSTVEDKIDEWKDKEAEADEREESDCDGTENKTSLLSTTKKRDRSTAGERPQSQRRTKRRRFSSPPPSDDETESEGESVISRYTPSKPYRISTARPTSSRLSRSDGDVSNGKMKLAGSRSNRCPIPKTTVIYERQSWAGEIIDEREVKQGRGRPRKQYLIQWEPSWVDAGLLTAPELLQNWRGKKASARRR